MGSSMKAIAIFAQASRWKRDAVVDVGALRVPMAATLPQLSGGDPVPLPQGATK